MRETPALRIVLSASVVVVFYVVLFTGSGPFRRSGGRELTAERAKQLADESRALMRSGDYAAALVPLNTLHEVYPGSHIYIDRLAVVYHHLNRVADEAAMLEEYLAKAPDPETACPRLGLAYRALSQEDKAFDAFKRCYDLEPTDPDAIFYLALANEHAGRTEDAAALYRAGLDRAPIYDDMRLGLARIALHQGRPDEARMAAVAVLAKHPDNTDALLVAGLACIRSGEVAQGRAYLASAVRLSPGNPELVEALAQAPAN